jgi:hypothetical protein
MHERRITSVKPESEWFSSNVYQSLTNWLIQQGKSPETVVQFVESTQQLYENLPPHLQGKLMRVGVAAIPVNNYGGVYIWLNHGWNLPNGQSKEAMAELDSFYETFCQIVAPHSSRQLTINPAFFDSTHLATSDEFTSSLKTMYTRSAIQYIGTIEPKTK